MTTEDDKVKSMPIIEQEHMAYAISALCKVVDSELTRMEFISDHKPLKEVETFLLNQYQSTNWFATFTAVNLNTLVADILQSSPVRAFCLNLAERVSFYWSMQPSPGYEKLVEFLAMNSAVNTPYDQTFLNPEVYESIKVDHDSIANMLKANPWIGVLIYAIRHLETTEHYMEWRKALKAYVPPEGDDSKTS